MTKIFLQEYDGYTLEWWEPSMSVISKPGKLDMGWKPGIDLSNVTKLEANLMLHAYHLAMKGGFTPVPSGYEWLRDEIPYSWWSPDGSIHKYVWMGYTKDGSGCWYPFNFICDKHRLSEAWRRAQQLRLLRDVDKKLEVKTTWHYTDFEEPKKLQARFRVPKELPEEAILVEVTECNDWYWLPTGYAMGVDGRANEIGTPIQVLCEIRDACKKMGLPVYPDDIKDGEEYWTDERLIAKYKKLNGLFNPEPDKWYNRAGGVRDYIHLENLRRFGKGWICKKVVDKYTEELVEISEKYIKQSADNTLLLSKVTRLEAELKREKSARADAQMENSSLRWKLNEVKKWFGENGGAIRFPSSCNCGVCEVMAKDRYEELKKILGV